MYSDVKGKDLSESFTGKWIYPETTIILSKVSQAHKLKYWIIPLISKTQYINKV